MAFMIIGVVGPIASGKNVFTDSLIEQDFNVWNLSDEVREEARSRGVAIERKLLQDIGNELREKFGNQYWAKRLLAKLDLNKNHVVTGIRNPGEIEELKKYNGFVLVGIDAPIEKRFQWIMARNKDSDPKNIEGVKIIDARDRGLGEGKSGQQVNACYDLADYYLMNDGTIEELKERSRVLLEKLLNV